MERIYHKKKKKGKLGLSLEVLKDSQRLMSQQEDQRKSNLETIGKPGGCNVMDANGKRGFSEGQRAQILLQDAKRLSKVIIKCVCYI